MTRVLFILLGLSYFTATSQMSSKEAVLYYEENCSGSLPCYIGKFSRQVSVSFDSGFDDSIQIKFNRKIVFNEKVTGTNYTDAWDKGVNIDYKKTRNKNLRLEIITPGKPNLFLIIYLKYYFIFISWDKHENKWYVTYSNEPRIVE